MSNDELNKLLEAVANHEISVNDANGKLAGHETSSLGFANVDLDRTRRTGYPETIYCSGKTKEQILKIAQSIFSKESRVLCTRIDHDKAGYIQEFFQESTFYDNANCLVIGSKPAIDTKSYIAIVTAGTSDISVAEEAAITAETFGNDVKRVYDVGVAGIHRLFAKLDIIQGAKVVVVIAGMEGALTSVVGGLVNKPVIAVPTSIGYGSNFNGLSALLTMLNSCSEGITVVNIDNGFGAGYSASVINHL